jgi:hypothetical protein
MAQYPQYDIQKIYEMYPDQVQLLTHMAVKSLKLQSDFLAKNIAAHLRGVM